MTVVSLAVGWVVAGRVLRPVRTITATTRRISQDNLHDRLALQGPSDELKDLADTIDELLARLEAAFTAQRRFVANASHELRTPLAMMRTSLDVAAGKPGPLPPQLGMLDAKLREGLDQADRLLERFLTLARAERRLPGADVCVTRRPRRPGARGMYRRDRRRQALGSAPHRDTRRRRDRAAGPREVCGGVVELPQAPQPVPSGASA